MLQRLPQPVQHKFVLRLSRRCLLILLQAKAKRKKAVFSVKLPEYVGDADIADSDGRRLGSGVHALVWYEDQICLAKGTLLLVCIFTPCSWCTSST